MTWIPGGEKGAQGLLSLPFGGGAGANVQGGHFDWQKLLEPGLFLMLDDRIFRKTRNPGKKGDAGI